jgi:hypothetical protein
MTGKKTQWFVTVGLALSHGTAGVLSDPALRK